LRLVLDTNVVLDLVVFDDADVRPLRAAIERGGACVFTCDDCLAELRRVLARPRFALESAAQDAAFASFRALAHRVARPAAPSTPGMPRCRDAGDQKFLALAWEVRADHLVTKDTALLELARRVAKLGRFAIGAPHNLAPLWPRA
jgi:putative PIN family toxin of toxin-antitoxin system